MLIIAAMQFTQNSLLFSQLWVNEKSYFKQYFSPRTTLAIAITSETNTKTMRQPNQK